MLFDSFEFLFGFLPLALAAYHGLRVYGKPRMGENYFAYRVAVLLWMVGRSLCASDHHFSVGEFRHRTCSRAKGMRASFRFDRRNRFQSWPVRLLQVCEFLFDQR